MSRPQRNKVALLGFFSRCGREGGGMAGHPIEQSGQQVRLARALAWQRRCNRELRTANAGNLGKRKELARAADARVRRAKELAGIKT